MTPTPAPTPGPYFPPDYFPAGYFPPTFLAGGPPATAGREPSAGCTYFAPSFFAPGFFAGVAPSAPAGVASINSTFAPRCYFPPSYFAGAYCQGQGPAPAEPQVAGDMAVFRAIAAELESVGPLESVSIGGPPAQWDRAPSAWLRPWRWKEDQDGDVGVRVRSCWFRMTLVAASSDFRDLTSAYEQLIELSSWVSNWFDDFAPTLPGLLAEQSRITEGVYPYEQNSDPSLSAVVAPLACLTLVGTFAYQVWEGSRA